MNNRPCKRCGSPIVGRRPDAIYCSHHCANRKRSAAFADRHPERIKANREVQNADTRKRIYSRVKSRAKIAGIPFDLELSDIVVPDLCPILGIPLVDRQGQGGGGRHNSPSLDRRDPSLGYVKGNVGVISDRANLLKSNMTLEELKKLVSYMEAER